MRMERFLDSPEKTHFVEGTMKGRPFDLWLAKSILCRKQTVGFNQRSTFLPLISVRDSPMKFAG